ncbi:MAG: helix-turn-helix domain-containing protein [Ginsengibacter sp.]|jgi:transcriptional regulator with XRE-family HTH domain
MNTTTTMRILRESKGYSQEYVGSVLGIEQNTYSKLESGQIRLTLERICKLAELYEVSADLLVSNELPIVNYNNGKFSKGIVNNENDASYLSKELYEKMLSLKDQLLEEKEKQILILKEKLSEQKAEKDSWKELFMKQNK